MHAKSFGFLVLLVMTVGALPVSGQVDVATATIKGMVTDPSGAAISGAAITVTSVDKGITKSAKTGADGTYRIPLLQPGVYEVEVQAVGFDRTVGKDVQLTVGQSLVYDVSLRVGAITNVVDVTADAPLIQAEQTQQANTINRLQVENLPNIGRLFTQTVFTLPGVSSSDATRSQQPGFTGFGTTGFSIGGSNGRNNLSTIDGGENEYGTGQYRVLPSVDSIQEFQVNRNSFAAEFGFTVGSTVNVVTKSGGNQFHGSAYAYFRDQNTEAANFFNRFLPSTTGSSGGYQKAYSQNFYPGGTIGGPIVKDKLFFFTSYEFTKLDQAGFNFLLNSAGALGINGTSIAGLAQASYFNQLASSGNPFLVGFAAALRPALVPQNNANLLKMLTTDNGGFNTATRAHTWLTRVDYQPNSNNSLTFRFELQHAISGHQSFPDGSGLTTRDYSILTNWAHTFSPTVINQVRVQIVPFNRADSVPNSDTGTFFSISELNGAGYGGAGTGFGFGHSDLLPYLAHQRRFQFEDNLSWTKGKHNFKFGASYRPVDYNVEDDLYRGGQFDFASGLIPLIALAPKAVQAQLVPFNLAHGFPATGPPVTNLSGPEAFVLGIPDFYHGGFGNFAWQGWAHYFGTFAQDSWKVSSKLTLDIGGRFDLDGEPSPLGRHSYFSPRFGFAWDPWENHKTVIRGGAGVFEGPIDVLIPSYGSLLDNSGRYISQVLSILASPNSAVQPTTLYAFGLQTGKLPFGHLTAADLNSLGVATGAGNPNRVVFVIDPNYRNPYSVQASLSIQRELFRNLSLEVGYNMYHGVHLQMPHDTSVKATGVVDPFVGPLYAPIDPKVFQQTTYSSIGKSIYHGLTVSLTKRYSSHLQFQANYTFSKTIDDSIDFASFQNWFRPDRLNQFRAVSVFDFPHVFVANAVYTTPFKAGEGNFLSRVFGDMTIAPILTLRSGIPFTVTVPGLRNGTNLDNLFATPYAAGRDTGRGFPYYNLDLRLQKSLYVIRDRGLRVDLIVEGINILNRVNFNSVQQNFPTVAGPVTLANGQVVNLLTGPYNLTGFKPTSIGDLSSPLSFQSADLPRQIQFGLKLAF
jgi:Carboxypeptidase regulatory-like domain